MAELLIAVGIMTGLGLFFGYSLAVAHRYLHVEEDPRIDATEERLPGNNCGACGQPGCRAFAEGLVAGTLQPASCTVASAETLAEIAASLGIAVGEELKRVARLRCGGAEGLTGTLAAYRGTAQCRAAVLVDGGGRACPWGCLGLGDCQRACTFDAIAMTGRGLPRVIVDRCTACGDCVDVCPLDLFQLLPLEQRVVVQCASPLVGDDATARCAVACDACGLCARASAGAITMSGGLAVVDPEARDIPAAAVSKCPTGAIQRLEGSQFTDHPDGGHQLVGRRHA